MPRLRGGFRCGVVISVKLEHLDKMFSMGQIKVHQQLFRSGNEVRKAAHTIFAVLELLVEKGLVEEAATRQVLEEVYARLRESSLGGGVGFLVEPVDASKYDNGQIVAVDCAARMELCQAACCSLRPTLTQEDIDERVAHWDAGEPYRARTGADGCCSHLDSDRACGIFDQRPHACRKYSCAEDPRIWKDFEAREPNPEGIEALRVTRAPSLSAEWVQMVRLQRRRKK